MVKLMKRFPAIPRTVDTQAIAVFPATKSGKTTKNNNNKNTLSSIFPFFKF